MIGAPQGTTMQDHARDKAEPFTPQPAAATAAAAEKVLCQHCGRTASNGLRCIGMCVADNEY
ncbi:MAG: hypothetical protein DBW85_01705 [Synechococcus sp. MED-G71]|jgi:hypothetical protein|nr:MAG: hypothetical protein DBW85_01705 [Synechococcus sp. MED-G71]|tara:strand:+ start:5230 stop:5415 length:186 start_codon:yes stop_codon:yes gene_type:complete